MCNCIFSSSKDQSTLLDPSLVSWGLPPVAESQLALWDGAFLLSRASRACTCAHLPLSCCSQSPPDVKVSAAVESFRSRPELVLSAAQVLVYLLIPKMQDANQVLTQMYDHKCSGGDLSWKKCSHTTKVQMLFLCAFFCFKEGSEPGSNGRN